MRGFDSFGSHPSLVYSKHARPTSLPEHLNKLGQGSQENDEGKLEPRCESMTRDNCEFRMGDGRGIPML